MLRLGLTSGSLALLPGWLDASPSEGLMQRAIPSSGELVPVIGLGSSASFEQAANRGELQGITEVLKVMTEHGARVFDTAPSYGASEDAAGRIAQQLKITDKLFWATKTEASYGNDNAAISRAQIQESLKKLGVQKLDLVQVHNLGGLQTTLAMLKDLKHQGLVRYLGVTTTFRNQYADLLSCMRSERLDFIGIDYAVDDREVETHILPAAIDRGIAVLCYEPFGRSNLFRRVGHSAVPLWAQEAGMKTWAQFFLKFVISHPAITVATPATSQSSHMLDNLMGGIGPLPDAAMRKRMVALVEALP
jgi:diketogulonate reductase-like aldo/keto reductase